MVPSRLRGAVKATYDVIDRVQPDVIVGYGGYVSVPAYLAARRRKLPLVIHEQNALPGIANKLGARFAERVAVSFPDTPLKNAEYVGLPLRRMISQLDRTALRAEARAFFGLDPDLPTLVVTGGSQGAWKLNRAVTRASAALGTAGVQVLHVIGARGKEDPDWVEPVETGTPYLVLPFVDRMDYALAAADLMVCRAGANSVVEAAATGVPTIFVPLAYGNGEQVHNARPVVEAGGALMADEAAFTADYVADTVPALAKDPARLAAMGAAASGLVPADADDRLARIVADVLRTGGLMRLPVPDEIPAAEQLGRVHFVGIGGAGLSGIARLMARRGVPVTGSDDNDTPFLAQLRELDVPATSAMTLSQVGEADTVVVTTAAREDNPEVVEARRRGLTLLPRSAGLKAAMDGQRVLAVAGTHGKTTTTSLLTVAMIAAGADPSYAVGGVLTATGRNADLGGGPYFVAEADESDGAFLVYDTYGAIVLNVEADHLDIWGTEAAYAGGVRRVRGRSRPAAGPLVIGVDDPGGARLARRMRERGRPGHHRRRRPGRLAARDGPRGRRRHHVVRRRAG